MEYTHKLLQDVNLLPYDLCMQITRNHYGKIYQRLLKFQYVLHVLYALYVFYRLYVLYVLYVFYVLYCMYCICLMYAFCVCRRGIWEKEEPKPDAQVIGIDFILTDPLPKFALSHTSIFGFTHVYVCLYVLVYMYLYMYVLMSCM